MVSVMETLVTHFPFPSLRKCLSLAFSDSLLLSPFFSLSVYFSLFPSVPEFVSLHFSCCLLSLVFTHICLCVFFLLQEQTSRSKLLNYKEKRSNYRSGESMDCFETWLFSLYTSVSALCVEEYRAKKKKKQHWEAHLSFSSSACAELHHSATSV